MTDDASAQGAFPTAGRKPVMVHRASRDRLFAIAALAAVFASQPAAADVEFTVRNAVAFLHSDLLAPRDAATVERFLAEPRATPLRIVYLDSRGGNTQAAIAIGRSIRSNGLSTGFHVGRGRCVSACTTMFLGGVARYYIGAEAVHDGIATHLGLGFHPSNGGAPGEQSILAYYRDMGVEGAAALRYKVYAPEAAEIAADHNGYRLYFVGGASALRAGVATSTREPADPALRD